MNENNIVISATDKRSLDKMQIALAIKNSTYGEELQCDLLTNAVINSCSDCNLNLICEGLEMVAQDYLEETTELVNSFSFQ